MFESDVESVLLSEAQVRAAVAGLAARISADYAGREPLLVGLLKGAVIFLADLMRALAVPHEVDFIAVSSYGASSTSSGVVRLLKDLDRDIEGRDVLLVEDIVDTGLTVDYLLRTLRERRPASLEVCVLLVKPAELKVDLQLRYRGVDIPGGFVVGYGMDYDERYRNLPYVAVLKPEVHQPAPQPGG
jgi:hypoxanthine phosphoribosyltransferase